jgi:hypothetical protein
MTANPAWETSLIRRASWVVPVCCALALGLAGGGIVTLLTLKANGFSWLKAVVGGGAGLMAGRLFVLAWRRTQRMQLPWRVSWRR